MSELPHHGRHPCRSCPFRREADGAFPPDVLERTVGENLRSETYVHRCHSTNGKPETAGRLCVGFLRFVRKTGARNALTDIGEALGVIDFRRISDKIPIAESWSEVLAIHGERLGLSGGE